MKAIDDAVTATLRGQPEQEETAAIWKALWTAYERGGVDEARAYVEGLCLRPDEDGAEGDGEVEP